MTVAPPASRILPDDLTELIKARLQSDEYRGKGTFKIAAKLVLPLLVRPYDFFTAVNRHSAMIHDDLTTSKQLWQDGNLEAYQNEQLENEANKVARRIISLSGVLLALLAVISAMANMIFEHRAFMVALCCFTIINLYVSLREGYSQIFGKPRDTSPNA